MKTFKNLGVAEPILKAIEEKFTTPSVIQEKTIPLVIKGKDVIAGSATGSGKTLAFGAGLVQKTARGKGIQALILTPTRELAEQITQVLHMLSKHKPLSILSVYGGVSINPQIEKLQTTDIVVGTPGRILDHLERRTIRLSEVQMLVLDEADRMLDMGFIDDVEKIMRACPKKKQTLLFSATISPALMQLSKKYMHDPVKVFAESQVNPKKLKQVYYDVPHNMKFSLLVHLLKKESEGIVMVFCNSRMNTDFVATNLQSNGINALAIHGGFSQDKRNKTLDQFHSKTVTVLVCTDVAARGLDIKDVSHVYNYDIPKDPTQYIHRIGRTARAGEKGKAVNILTQPDYEHFRRITHEHTLDVDKAELPRFKRVFIKRVERTGPRGPRSHSRTHSHGRSHRSQRSHSRR